MSRYSNRVGAVQYEKNEPEWCSLHEYLPRLLLPPVDDGRCTRESERCARDEQVEVRVCASRRQQLVHGTGTHDRSNHRFGKGKGKGRGELRGRAGATGNWGFEVPGSCRVGCSGFGDRLGLIFRVCGGGRPRGTRQSRPSHLPIHALRHGQQRYHHATTSPRQQQTQQARDSLGLRAGRSRLSPCRDRSEQQCSDAGRVAK